MMSCTLIEKQDVVLPIKDDIVLQCFIQRCIFRSKDSFIHNCRKRKNGAELTKMNALLQDIQNNTKEDIDPVVLQQMFQQYLKQNTNEANAKSLQIQPKAGYVLKTSIKKANADIPLYSKLFINICHSTDIPAPPELSDLALQNALENPESSHYKIPLSLSSFKSDVDKSGKQCLVMDACMNSEPFNRSKRDKDFQGFLMDLCLAFIESRHQIDLDRFVSFPTLKCKGDLSLHTIRKTVKPLVSPTQKPLMKPHYSVLKEPEVGDIEFLVIQIQLPECSALNQIGATLDIEANRVLFFVPDFYELILPLPISVDTLEGGAQFDCQARVLTVTLHALK